MSLRPALLALALAVAALLLGGCAEAAVPPAATPVQPAEEPVFRPARASTPEATAAAPALTDGDIEDALQALVCWYDDPDLARSCLPPGEGLLAVLGQVAASDDERFVAPLIDMLWLDLGWERWVREALERLTGERLGSAADWYAWAMTAALPLPEGYAEWKGRLLSIVDPELAALLPEQPVRAGPGPERLIWSLARPGAVPPLVDPEHVHRVEEQYLGDNDLVFGVVVDGVQRAYPERIVGWHGSVADEVNGARILVWHCSICGGAAVFNRAASDGVEYTFHTAGLVWESRRLFVDAETGSLWDAVSGRAIAGPLAALGVRLTPRVSVRTTWGEWAARYPNTRVLSLDTGHVRDYDEGASLVADSPDGDPAFPVSGVDDRLPAKTRVLGVSVDGAHRAYALSEVESRGLVFDAVGGTDVVIYSPGPGRGATVYEAGGTEFRSISGPPDDRIAADAEELTWFVDDERLLNTRNSRVRNALPAQVAYWFAWSGAYPSTELWQP